MKQFKFRVLFVGGVALPKAGKVLGGQVFACLSLLSSPLSQHVEWILLNTAQDTILNTSIWKRLFKAVIRICRFILYLIFKHPNVILIFSGSGASMFEKGIMACLAHTCGLPVVFAPRGSGITRAGTFERQIVRLMLSKCSFFICQSSYWQNFYHELLALPLEQLIIIKNWIDPSPYLSMEHPPKRKEVAVLFLGWMVRLKGIFDLLEVVSNKREYFHDVKFYMCGAGDDFEKFHQAVVEFGLSNNFELMGWVEGNRKLDIIRKADILILPSYGEGMPNSLLEGMAAGRPILATRVGGIPDLISDGVEGLLFEPGDQSNFFECLNRLCKDRELRTYLGCKARERILRDHTIESAWPKILALLENASTRHKA